ncbi:MAG: UDP-N-acetylmuramoylalanine--D-glutamate ligase [Actinomycetia bacterium]|nr:UDP-N-acetylmuramoylalanine--D-glutamate ligase [Actinomycetes bacterium]
MTGAEVIVLGLGVTGRAVVTHLLATGAAFSVLVDQVRSDEAAWADEHGVEIFAGARSDASAARAAAADLIVPSPGVPESHPAIAAALAAGVPVRSEIDLAAELARVPIVAVTGTNGKTSVTTLITEMLVASEVRAESAGNIGRPLLEAVHDDVDVIVAEVSSFQLRFTPTFAPRIAVYLNVAEDHLDWHGSFEAYARAKAAIFTHQRAGDVLVYNADDALVHELAQDAPARRVGFSVRPEATSGFRLAHGELLDADSRAIVAVDELQATAPYELANVLASAAAALEAGATPDGVRIAALNFARLPHRARFVGKAGGVTFVDDSKATNPHATRAAVQAYDKVVLIAGGRNKGLDLSLLRPIAPNLRAVVAIGEAAAEVEAAFGDLVPVEHAHSMREAVRGAARRAEPGDTVLLSPACASFDWYSGYAERGDDFAAEVELVIRERGGDGDPA